MNLLTDAVINIESRLDRDGSLVTKRTIKGTTQSISAALVRAMQLTPALSEAVEMALKVYNDPALKDMKKPAP